MSMRDSINSYWVRRNKRQMAWEQNSPEELAISRIFTLSRLKAAIRQGSVSSDRLRQHMFPGRFNDE